MLPKALEEALKSKKKSYDGQEALAADAKNTDHHVEYDDAQLKGKKEAAQKVGKPPVHVEEEPVKSDLEECYELEEKMKKDAKKPVVPQPKLRTDDDVEKEFNALLTKEFGQKDSPAEEIKEKVAKKSGVPAAKKPAAREKSAGKPKFVSNY